VKALRTWVKEKAEAKARESLTRRLETLARGSALLRDEIEEWAAEGRDRAALIGEGETLAFRDLYERANRWARWAIIEGIARAEPVALLFSPRPERTPAWVGLGAVGAVPTLFDPALGETALAAAIGAIRPRHMVVDAALLPLFEAAAARLGHACTVWVHGPHPMAYQRIDETLAGLSAVRLTGRDRRSLDPGDVALAVVAPGPEGRPRVGHLDHGRLGAIATLLATALGATRDDRLAVVETALSLETLLAPTIALARGAPCRLIARNAAEAVAVPADATVLHLDHPPRDAVPPGARLIVGIDAEAGPDTPEPPQRRTWSIRRDDIRVELRLDGHPIALPASDAEMRS